MNLNENNSPIFAGYLAGVRGTPFGKYECYPFVVNQKGRVDFGSNFVTREDEPTAEVDARYGSTNILHKTIEVGETFNMTEDDEDNTYKIRRVIPV